ncbi:mannosyltransferase [Flavobacteriaceae bacterium]|nr:mannosyltransferase [Flavobacteriaceae bacterium]MDB4324945.1 mannosyltransferase [Flavobacteriaceae bacterium]
MLLYFLFAYFLERSDFLNLLLLYSGLFYAAWKIIQYTKFNFWIWAVIGITARVLFLPSIPNLSQDFYRFIWDGRLLILGINPYVFTPEQLANGLLKTTELTSLEAISNAKILIQGMGSLNASHYSNYPPINQLCFALAALFAKTSVLGSVIVLRIIIIGADLGILYFGKKLLERLDLPEKNIFWYFLNPFIIIELTGNLHFEGVMLFFVIWSLYLLDKKRWVLAAILLGVSVSVKLLPLLFLPLFYKYLAPDGLFKKGFWKMKKFYWVTLATIVFTFAPFASKTFISNFSATIGLWFQNFEFNASVYYIIRWIGFQTVGWNIIATVGLILPMVVFICIVLLAVFRKYNTTQKLITGMLLAVSIYFLLATTVHPWYITTPLLLSVFTKYKFPLLWSFMICFSYAAYGANGFNENLSLVAIEYSVVIGVALWEIFIKKLPEKGVVL